MITQRHLNKWNFDSLAVGIEPEVATIECSVRIYDRQLHSHENRMKESSLFTLLNCLIEFRPERNCRYEIDFIHIPFSKAARAMICVDFFRL